MSMYSARIAAVAGVAVAVGWLTGHAPSAAGTAKYKLVESWRPIPANADVTWEMSGVATDLEGRRLFAEKRSDPPVLEIDPQTGKILKTWGAGLIAWPHAMYLDRQGYVWLVDAAIGPGSTERQNPPIQSAVKAGKGHQVTKLTADGKIVLTLGTPGVPGNDEKHFNAPTGVVVASNGDIFVSDGHGGNTNARIVKFSKDGKFIKAWGTKGSGPGEFNGLHAIAMDSQGRVLVADRSNNRIQVFDQAGTFIAEWKQYPSPSGITVTPDDTMFVTTLQKKIIVGDAKTGAIKGVLEEADAEGIAADGHGHLYTAGVFDRALKKYVAE